MQKSEKKITAPPFDLAAAEICPACGTVTRRGSAKFCAVCGRILTDKTYYPADALKASYHLQTQRFAAIEQPAETARFTEGGLLFPENKNSASTTATAFVVYSLVPFLGILFCPGAFIFSGIGFVNSYRYPDKIGRATAVRSLVAGTIVLGIQIFLWWLLYLIPELR